MRALNWRVRPSFYPHAATRIKPVETFALTGHPKAQRCHAWNYEENGEMQYVTVLELPPVDSAETAVKVAIAAKARQ